MQPLFMYLIMFLFYMHGNKPVCIILIYRVQHDFTREKTKMYLMLFS